ncbi:hypothetical protein GQ457_05G000030 [Hibiscus cannabinus]
MSLFKMPVAVYRKLSSLMARFLWGGSADKRKIHWVKWSEVCLPKSLGGLGVIDLDVQNRALCGKWIWKFASNRKSFWSEIMVSKYKYDSNCLIPSSKVKGKPSWIWNNIIKSFEAEDPVGLCLKNNLKVQVGDGSTVRFWMDCWITDTPLSVAFPRIFAVCSSKLGTIADFGRKENGVWVWNIPLRRQLFDWEIEIWNSLLELLNGFRNSSVDEDWVRWMGSGDGKFSVKSLVSNLYGHIKSEKEWGVAVWRGVAPPKVEVFTWLVVRNRIPVKGKLAARGLLLNNDTLCPFCGLFPKEVSHLLFSCKVAWLIWVRCAAFWDVSFVCPNDPGIFLLSWHEACISRSSDSIWHLIPFAILWTIWLLRNEITFANGHLDNVQLFFLVRTRTAIWFKAKFPKCTCSVDDLIADPSVADKWGKSKVLADSKRRWEPPSSGFLKLNVDGAMDSRGVKGGIGGLIRNNLGVCLDKFSLSIGPGPPVLAELEAILHGLRLFFSSRKFENFKLVVECDCLVAIEWIFNSSSCPPAFESIVRGCRELVLSNSVVLRHIPRYLNVEADVLAKEGIG